MPNDDAGEFGDLALKLVQPIAEVCFQAKAAIVQPLFQPVQQRIHPPLDTLRVKAVNFLARVEKLKTRSPFEPHVQTRDALGNFVLGFGNQLGRSGRRGRTKICNKIGNRKVRLVAHRGDNRQLRCGDGARHPLVVEGCQVFE